MLRDKLDPPSLRAAWWALRALSAIRGDLKSRRIHDVRVPGPPQLSEGAARGVAAVLRRRQHTCLERALLLQTWYASQGQRRDVVIGVTSPADSFAAHAWLDGDPDGDGDFEEVLRLSAPEQTLVAS
jgi:hypothetical protein